jgi:hypothetical protein
MNGTPSRETRSTQWFENGTPRVLDVVEREVKRGACEKKVKKIQ